MKLIDKDKIVAELEKLITNGKLKCQQSQENNDQVSYIAWSEHIATCGKILLFLDTLEMKEADLEKEIDKFYGMYRKNGITFSIEDNQECLDWKEDCNPDFEIGFARHFFELGMTVSNKA